MDEREAVALSAEHPRSAPDEAGAGPAEPFEELAEVGDDEAAGCRRRRGADVGGEVAERRVLLVPDRRDNWNRATRDGTDEPLVAEGEEILEAPSPARDDDHVQFRRGRQ